LVDADHEVHTQDRRKYRGPSHAPQPSGGGVMLTTPPQLPEFAAPGKPVRKPRKPRRIFMWTFLALQALFLALVIIQLQGKTGPSHADLVSGCYHGAWQGLFKSQHDCVVHFGSALNGAGEAGKGIGAALIFGLWIGIDVILGVGRLVVVLARRKS
jgi:hypothetical protein